MSTRAIIARAEADGWTGRYHHFDGYPSGLGASLYQLYHGHFARDIERMLTVLVDEHPAGWSNIQDCDFTQPIGFGDTGPRCYCHGGRAEPDDTRTHDDPNYEEYLYVLSTYGRRLTIFDTHGQWQEQDGEYVPTPNYQPALIASIDLDSDEPDWATINQRRRN